MKKPILQADSENWSSVSDFYVMAYAGVEVHGDEIIETIPTNPLNGAKNTTLEFHFKFTGDAIELMSVKKVQ